MKHRDYWRRRFEQLETAQLKKGYDYYADLEREYKRVMESIEKDILKWYTRFAKNNEISFAEAKRMLNTRELTEFRWTVQEYIKYGQENAINGAWMKQLENASAWVHISRLESLKLQMQQQVEVLYGNQLDGLDKAMRRIYTDGYYHTAYEIQRGIGVGWDLHRLDDRRVSAVISKPWTADIKNFSGRIWGSKDQLVNTLHTELTQAIIRGDAPDKAIKSIADKFNVSKKNAGRLVMTESAFFASAAQQDCFNELDVERYEIVATLDNHTSELCQSLDGKVFDMKDYKVGTTAPPFHCWCRTVTVPYFDDNTGERAARDADGKTYYVPTDMKYPDWKKSFVDGDNESAKIKVTSKTYCFSNGTNRPNGEFIKPATVYTNKNGVEFIYPRDYDETVQTIKPERAIELFNRVPPELQQLVKTVEFVDYENPQDTYWAKTYKIKNFRSFAIGGGDKMTFFKNGYDVADNRLLHTYCHEIGHMLDVAKEVAGERIANSITWKEAVAADYKVSKEKYVSNYPKQAKSLIEDFAEAIAFYVQFKEKFMQTFPNRSEIIRRILENDRAT